MLIKIYQSLTRYIDGSHYYTRNSHPFIIELGKEHIKLQQILG